MLVLRERKRGGGLDMKKEGRGMERGVGGGGGNRGYIVLPSYSYLCEF